MQTHSEIWQQRYFDLAKTFSSWSKDPSKGVGAIAVTHDKQILSEGWNGFPRGVQDSFERLNDREMKYRYVVHAEKNLIYNATKNGVRLDGAILYVYGLPVCSECAKGIIQVGIKSVNILTEGVIPDRWADSWKLTTDMFEETGVHYEWYQKP